MRNRARLLPLATGVLWTIALALIVPSVSLSKGSPWKLALHSVSYAGVWRGQAYLDIERFLETAKQLGFDGVMIMAKEPHVSPLTYDEKARARLKARLNDLGLELCILAGYTDFTGGIDRGGIPVAEIQAAYVGQLAKLAADLGTDKVRIFTGYLRPGIPYDQQYGTVVRGIKLAAREAAKYGVTLAIQNHHDIANYHEEMLWLLREVNEPNVKLAFDAWTPTLQGLSSEELAEAVAKVAPYMVHTTVADYVRFPRFQYEAQLTNFVRLEPVVRAVPMGTGIVDYGTFFRSLKKAGYKGWVAYEMCEVLEGGGSLENLARTARQFLEYMRNLDLE
ncbi:MAG: sugar phosphate isomerase/epimerase [candidate division KSB1 bacterium]|nr:sugar phosphate isomerase/epimerase [candidate division KSB1 bacterium]